MIVVDDASARPVPGALRQRRARRRRRRAQRRPESGPQRDRRAARQRHRPAAGLAGAACSRTSTTPRWTSSRRASCRCATAATKHRHSPLDRGPDAARVVPYGRVPFVPGAALLVRSHVRFDETLTHGGEDVELVWRTPYVRYEPSAHVAHAHRTEPRAWLARRVYYGKTAAAIAHRHPGQARPLHVSPWTTAAWTAALLGRPKTAMGITAVATALLARETRTAHGGGARRPGQLEVRPRRRRRPHPPLVAARPRPPAYARRVPDQAPVAARRRPRLRHRRVARVHTAPHTRPTSARQSLEARPAHSVRLRRR